MKKQYKRPSIIKKEKIKLAFAACNAEAMTMCAPGTLCDCQSGIVGTLCSIGTPCGYTYA